MNIKERHLNLFLKFCRTFNTTIYRVVEATKLHNFKHPSTNQQTYRVKRQKRYNFWFFFLLKFEFKNFAWKQSTTPENVIQRTLKKQKKHSNRSWSQRMEGRTADRRRKAVSPGVGRLRNPLVSVVRQPRRQLAAEGFGFLKIFLSLQWIEPRMEYNLATNLIQV